MERGSAAPRAGGGREVAPAPVVLPFLHRHPAASPPPPDAPSHRAGRACRPPAGCGRVTPQATPLQTMVHNAPSPVVPLCPPHRGAGRPWQ